MLPGSLKAVTRRGRGPDFETLALHGQAVSSRYARRRREPPVSITKERGRTHRLGRALGRETCSPSCSSVRLGYTSDFETHPLTEETRSVSAREGALQLACSKIGP